MSVFPDDLQETTPEQSQKQVITSTDIKEIFAPGGDGHEPRSILIEGAPGIGKTILSKEIAFQWAKGLLLLNKVLLFLLFLRDPLVQRITSLKGLVKHYYRLDESSDSIASSCAEYLLYSDGEDVIFVFDGFDEYPENLRQNGFICDILQRKVLPCCHLVVTSRPHASAYLRTICDRYIKILGFTEEGKQNYITSSLKKKQNVYELVEYLDDHLNISSLCSIPFNMTVLLWLYKHKKFTVPNSSSDLYDCFICFTIRHHLAKYHISLPGSFVDLNSLAIEECRYWKVIIQLSLLSYQALDKDKDQSTFTLDEIKATCPQIDEVPEALNGFGLLQAVQEFGTTTMNFAHLSLQEFLAAYYISWLPHYDEFCVLQKHFKSEVFVNTFTMYAGLTKGQLPAFQLYLSGGSKLGTYMYATFEEYGKLGAHVISKACLAFNTRTSIASIVAIYHRKKAKFWLRLFRCFYEAGDALSCTELIETILKFFHGNVPISEMLNPNDVESLGLFLSCLEEWKGLYFHYSINDVGIKILHRVLTKKTMSTCIDMIYISNDHLKDKSLSQSSSCLITEIAKKCKTKVLQVFSPVLLLKDVASLKNQLTKLIYVEISQTEMTVCLHDDKILEVLNLHERRLSEGSVEAFTEVLKHCNVNWCSKAQVKCMKWQWIIKLIMLKGVFNYW